MCSAEEVHDEGFEKQLHGPFDCYQIISCSDNFHSLDSHFSICMVFPGKPACECSSAQPILDQVLCVSYLVLRSNRATNVLLVDLSLRNTILK